MATGEEKDGGVPFCSLNHGEEESQGPIQETPAFFWRKKNFSSRNSTRKEAGRVRIKTIAARGEEGGEGVASDLEGSRLEPILLP